MEHIVDIPDNIETINNVFGKDWIMGLPVREEIIRCRDCCWLIENATPEDPDGRVHFCRYIGFDMAETNGYCAWAVKKHEDM